MSCINLGVESCQIIVRDKLEHCFSHLKSEGLRVEIKEVSGKKITIFRCRFAEKAQDCKFSIQEAQEIFTCCIANVIADIIIHNYEKAVIESILDKRYAFFTEDEKQLILSETVSLLDQLETKRGVSILQKILEYLNSSNEIVVDGFIRFRLQDYLNDVEDTVERVVDNYILERESKDFIRLLQYFVEIQEPRAEEVHIVLGNNGEFSLEDEKGLPVDKRHFDDFVCELQSHTIKYDDFLISALITIAPKKIVLHVGVCERAKEIMELLWNVFGKRLKVCSECHRCLRTDDR